MSLYKKYLAESYKEYNYRIKTVAPLSQVNMDKIENVLRKYDMKSITNPRVTPVQENPLEFYNIHNHEVYIVDVVTGMPASTFNLQNELKQVLDVPLDYIVVRADNDPIELYTEQITQEKTDYEVKLSTDPEYNADEGYEETAFGDDYNQQFLSRIGKARMKIESEVKDDNAEFNKDIAGVKPHYGTVSSTTADKKAPTGNYDTEGLDMKNKIR